MKPSLHPARAPAGAVHVTNAGLQPFTVTASHADGAPGLPERLWRAGLRALEVLLSWADRARQRSALRHLSDRELRDIGIDRVDAGYEACKPFWRA